jgi:hypothetical protein
MKRRDFITLLGGAACWPRVVRAQQATPYVAVIMVQHEGDALGQVD